MHFFIQHTTEYHFTRPVFFEPHQLRFQPRADGAQRLTRFDLAIEPTPAGVTRSLDFEGNVVTLAWFNDVHDRMVIRTQSEVETLRDNAFDYLLTPINAKLPVEYRPWEAAQLSAALRRNTANGRVDPIHDMAQRLCETSHGETVPFLTRLVETVYERFKVIHREGGGPWPPATTFEQQQGSCRDLAVLFIDACRAVGLAARFVSGYQEGDQDQDKRYLHAWAEVYIPGAGWRGYDPTHGLTVTDRHVVVAAAADPLQAAPVTATYRGNNVQAELRADVQIKTATAATLSVPASLDA